MRAAPDLQGLIAGEQILELHTEGDVVGQEVLNAGADRADWGRRLVLHLLDTPNTGAFRSLKSVKAMPPPPTM